MRKIVLVTAALSVLAGCNPFESHFITVCEGLVKERLRSPSGYERIEIERFDRKLTREEFAQFLKEEPGYEKSDERHLRSFDEGKETPMRFIAYIKYDAPNAYGTLIRGINECEYISNTGDEKEASKFNVRLDGKTYVQWLTESAD